MFVTQVDASPREALARLRAAVTDLQGLDLTASDDAEVLELLRELETQARRLPSVEHALIAEAEARHLAHQRACPSTARLLGQLLRVGPHEAAARVAAAAALGPRRTLTGQPLPAIFEATAAACAAGAVSARHAAVITTTIGKLPAAVAAELDHTIEQLLLSQAGQTDPTQLAGHARDLRAALDQDGTLAEDHDRQRRRDLRITQRPDGSAHGSFDLDAITAEALLTFLDTTARPAPAQHGAKDPRSAGQRRHDALRDGLLMLIRSGQLPDCGGVAATILLTLTDTQLHTGDGLARTGHGATITARQALTLLGDAQLIPIRLGPLKRIEAYGTTHRIFTPNQRLAMTARDGGCSFPACPAPPAWCQAHHVTDFTLTRHTRVDDGTLLCGYHHREHHRLGWHCHMIDGIPHWTPPRWIDPQQTPQRNHAHDRLNL